MFKKLGQKIRQLSLSEQFFSIILIVFFAVSVTTLILVNTQIDEFVNAQMYAIIDRSQQVVLHGDLLKNTESKKEFGYIDPNITHYLIYGDNSFITNSPENPSGELVAELLSQTRLQKVPQDHYKLPAELGSRLYTITRVNESTNLVSTISVSYQNSFRDILLKTIIWMILILLGINLLVLFLWVFSIIKPLVDIREYLKGVGKPRLRVLDLNREDEIGDVARAVVEMEDQIARQEQVKMEMVHNISHDLKTPITAIKTYSESIKDGIYPYGTLERSVDVILENAERLEHKAESLLLINRIDASEDQPLKIVDIDMQEVVSKSILSLVVVRPEIQLKTNTRNIFLPGDYEAWRVIVENLLDNALRYAESIIVVTVDENGLYVYNDGSQLDESNISALFRAYEKGNDGKFGLGLSIVDRLARKMGYIARAQNARGGVIFSIERGVVVKPETRSRTRSRYKKS